jgi:Alpha/beta hydrolase domain
MLMFGRLRTRSDRWRTFGLVGRVPLATALVLGMLASTALAHSHEGYDRRTATVPLPQIEGPIPVTDSSHIWNGAAWQWVPIDLSKYGYVEEEYYVSGRSNVYEAIPYSDYKVKSLRSGPYTTRITVRRPENMKRFSGRVAVEIINMASYYDWTANWGALWETIVKKGDVYVGITSAPNVFPGMVRFDPERYGRLSMANPLPPDQQSCGTLPDDPNYDPFFSKLYENGLAYDIFSQVGALIKSNGESNPLGRRAKRSYLVGESASGWYITGYFKWIHQLANVARGEPVYDGYLIEDFTTGPITDTILNQCAALLADDDPQRFVPGRGVPLTVVNSEVFYPEVFFDPGVFFHGRKPDSNTAQDKFALWMLTGASHGWTFQYDYSDAAQADLEKADLFDPNFPHFVCGPRQPEVNLYMAEKAMYLHLDRWVLTGKAPPHAPDPVVENGEYVRDADGNTLGGLRFPELQAPVATYTGVIVPSLDCTDAVNPFTQARIDELYSTHADYVRKYVAATLRLFRGGYILKEDAEKLIKAAHARPIP